MKYMKSTIITIVLVSIIAITLMTGYVKCIIHLCQCDFKESYKAEVIYTVGLATGTGSVIGWFDFGK